MKSGTVTWFCPHIPIVHFVAMPQACVMALQVLLFAVCHPKMYLASGYYTEGLMIPDTAESFVLEAQFKSPHDN